MDRLTDVVFNTASGLSWSLFSREALSGPVCCLWLAKIDLWYRSMALMWCLSDLLGMPKCIQYGYDSLQDCLRALFQDWACLSQSVVCGCQ
jgi:hypothetical protein